MSAVEGSQEWWDELVERASAAERRTATADALGEAIGYAESEYDRSLDEPSQRGPAPNRLAFAAWRVLDHFGWYYDPVLGSTTAVEYVVVVAAAFAAWDRGERVP